MLILFFT